MSCVETMPAAAVDSEMEEGEIVDELDDLSDISSEEEFLLRQRLQVLENYNNVLERKKAKGSSVGSGRNRRKDETLLQDLSEISASELEDTYTTHITVYRNLKDIKHYPMCRKEQKHLKVQHKHKKKKDPLNVPKKEYKKKNHRIKKRLQVKVISESSEESDDEYRNKRRKLANAVSVTNDKADKSSLKMRLDKMLRGTENDENLNMLYTEGKLDETKVTPIADEVICLSTSSSRNTDAASIVQKISDISEHKEITEMIDLCIDDDAVNNVFQDSRDTVDSATDIKTKEQSKNKTESDSDEDLELLRQHALKTKASNVKIMPTVTTVEPSDKPLSEDEDSDTAELRMICLKSALLKKAIEMKQKQKLRKRLSQSSNLQDELKAEQDNFINKFELDNNTDIESVDMEIGSDVDDKSKEQSIEIMQDNVQQKDSLENLNIHKDFTHLIASKEDELEDDEDLLRAKLLTSLTKNLPNLVDPSVIDEVKSPVKLHAPVEDKSLLKNQNSKIPEEKRFIITIGESDSEGEHEATKNLTKMHMKLSEQIDFQQKLDLFLKSTRMEVEKVEKLPDVVQQPVLPNNTKKFVAKAVKNLPKSEQLEYKNLVKRMAELEKIKQVRQNSMNLLNKAAMQQKETLKPRNVTVDSNKLNIKNIDEQIAMSRKKIAEESAKMLKLKEEATKLTQKYKIAATELRNITTAINFNKKEQRAIQNRLSKIRVQHQMLLKSSTFKHSKNNSHLVSLNQSNKLIATNKLQKENNPSKEEYKSVQMQKMVKVSVVNDLNDDTKTNPRLSVELDVTSNKKTVKIPSKINETNLEDVQKNTCVNIDKMNSNEEALCARIENESDANHPKVEKGGGKCIRGDILSVECTEPLLYVDDYRSPLQALKSVPWDEDPNAFLCPFEVGGNCKDPDCKYLHPKIPPIH